MNRRITYSLLVACCALLLFVPFLGSSNLFDWDEINFAECAREMVVTGDYSSVSINYEPFWEKPPLFIWMQALCMEIFGTGEFAARLPNALCGALTLLVLFNIGRRVYDERFGLIWVIAYAGSLLPHFYFRSGIIDPWFNLFIFSGIWFFIVFLNANQPYRPGLPVGKELLLAGACLGLAVMTKGPAALVIFGLCFGVYLLRNRFRAFMSFKQLLAIGLAVVITGSIWFMIELMRGRGNVISEFFAYQVRLFRTEDAGHGGPFYYHFIVLLIGCFPAAAFALHAFLRRDTGGTTTPWQRHVGWWMKMLLLVVLILFSFVETKIIHYSSLTYFPLTFLAARTIYRLWNGETVWRVWMSWMLGV
ncbi:MAG: glycosyl transferase family protein [Bacteroidetes bacterium]|nr:MAG: glycosyl transferase family protein [Bacteroidota bacterium]